MKAPANSPAEYPAFMNRKFFMAAIIVVLALALLRSVFVEAGKTVDKVNSTVRSFESVVNSLPSTEGSIDITQTNHIQIRARAPHICCNSQKPRRSRATGARTALREKRTVSPEH